jgi:hypothetical protein
MCTPSATGPLAGIVGYRPRGSLQPRGATQPAAVGNQEKSGRPRSTNSVWPVSTGKYVGVVLGALAGNEPSVWT